MSVTQLRRFAVKGLDYDELDSVKLESGGGFPNDRRWALHYEDADVKFAAERVKEGGASRWVHKANFLCAFTAPELLGQYKTRFLDETCTLLVARRSDGEQLLSAKLTDAFGRARVARFFSMAHRPVHLVEAEGPHHFGNTAVGFKYDASGAVIHLVNEETVAALSEAASAQLHASRFRPNVVISGVPAWTEFSWIGKRVRLGGAELEVLSRTVRCLATHVDAQHGSGAADIDVPQALSTYYPQYGPYLGVYLRVVRGGTVRTGDSIVLQPARSAVTSTVVVLAFAVLLPFLLLQLKVIAT
mmetsp:Transcript_56833/g.130511  ORF Transcript_56833/g.130511 Transcript_56833/m.130511 type:complete len:301 (-) Transcript_56833:639-1541(-)